MSTYLNKALADDLNNIDWRLSVGTMLDMFLRAGDKEFSIPASLLKGHGPEFKYCLKENYPGSLLCQCKQPLDCNKKCAAAIYWNRHMYTAQLFYSYSLVCLQCQLLLTYYIEILDE